jgi:hypothetical protein
MRRFLDALDGSAVGFWFDTGHGAMHRHLGFFERPDRSVALRDRLVGMHIHDVDGVDDHFAPYERRAWTTTWTSSSCRRSGSGIGKKNSAEAVVRGALTLQKKLADRKTGADA